MTLRLNLCGQMSISKDGNVLALPPSRKTRALLAYLAMSDRPVLRERLCELFWDIPDDPRGALRWSLSKLRPILNDGSIQRLQAKGQTIFLDKRELESDFAEILSIRPSDIPNLGLERLETVVHTYRGPLMDDLALPNCPLFEAWRVALADEMELILIAVLKGLISRTSNVPHRCLTYARALNAMDPDNVEASRLVAELTSTVRRAAIEEKASDPLAIAVGDRHVERPAGLINAQQSDCDTAALGEQELRQVTALYIELVSPLLNLEDLDPETVADQIDPAMDDVIRRIEQFGGACAFRGHTDVTAVFGARSGVEEEHAFQACQAVLAIRKALAQGHMRSAINFRAAIDTGDAVIGPGSPASEAQITVSGSPIRIARRMGQAVTGPVSIISERTRNAAGGYIESEPIDLQNLQNDWRFFELKGETGRLSRWHMRGSQRRTPFVGRDLELQLLLQALDKSREGRGRCVGIVADPGIGKSRLAHELAASDRLGDASWIECGAFEFDSQISLILAKKLLLALCEVSSVADEKSVDAALDDLIGSIGDPGVLFAPLRFVLDLKTEDQAWQSLPSSEQLNRVATAIGAVLSHRSESTPMVLLIEDLHWIDEASETVLRHLASMVPALPVLFVCTYRPSYTPAWSHPQTFQQIALKPLEREAALTILINLLGTDPSLKSTLPILADRTDGVPLYIEEIVRALEVEGRLIGEAGAYQLGQDFDDLALPPSLQSLLVANLSGLDQECRSVLQLAAAIGRNVPASLLEKTSNLDPHSLGSAVNHLSEVGLLVRARVHPITEYRIKHALVQEAAYSTITRKNRLKLHRRILDILTQDHATDQMETLAHHALLASEWDAAGNYYLQSANRALERSAHGIALAHIRQGLNAVANLPASEGRYRREIDLLKVEGVAWMAARGWGAKEVLQAYDRAAELSIALGDNLDRFAIMRGKAQYFMISGRPNDAQEIAQECACIVQETDPDNTGLKIETSHMFWTNGFFLGDYPTVLKHAANSRAIYDSDIHHTLTYIYSGHDPGVCCRVFLGLARQLCGRPEQSSAIAEALHLADQLQHPLSLALAYWGMSFSAMFQEDANAVLTWSDQEISICDQYNLPLLRSQGEFTRGWAIARSGNLLEGIRGMEIGLEGIRESGAQMGYPYLLSQYASEVARTGDFDRAIEALDLAVSQVEKSGSRFQFSEILRAKGLILMHAGDDGENAERLFKEGLSVARRQHALLAEHRAMKSLSEFLREAGRHDEADKLPNLS